MKTKKSTLIGIAIVFVMAIAIFTFAGCPEVPEQEFPTEFIWDVIVSPKTPNVVKGDNLQFTATVYGTDNIALTVTWTIETSGKNAGTAIDSTGKLTVAAAETLSSLIVKATSTADRSKSDTATVRIYNPGELPPTVTDVTVSPENQYVVKGGTQQFTATVTGENNPAQTVTWSIVETNKNSATTINSSGLLSIASGETLTSLTVRAASTVDTSVSGTAVVMISGGQIYFIEVTPSTPPPVNPGKTQQFTATVHGDPGASQDVTWTFGNVISGVVVSTGSAVTQGGSAISSSGLLTVGENETLSTLYVVATSTADTSISGYMSVRKGGLLLNASGGVYDNAIVKGGSTNLSASDIEYNYFQTSDINWSIVEANKAAGTYIADNANLKVDANETLLNLTIRGELKSNPEMTGSMSLRVVTVDSVTFNTPITQILVLPRGGNYTFPSVTVHGENNPPQYVYWMLVNADTLDPGTTIDFTTGKFNIGAGERKKTLEVVVITPLSDLTAGAVIYPYNPNAGAGYVLEIDDQNYDGTGKKTITLPLKENEIFLSKVNPTADTLLSGGMEVPSISRSLSIRPAQRNVQSAGNNNTQALPGVPAVVQAFNANPPPIPANLKTQRNSPLILRSLSAAQIGDEKQFMVINERETGSEQVTAKLLATGTHSNIWVVEDLINTGLAQAYADRFDILYPAVTNVFGYEYGGGPGGDGGKDGDPKIQILFCRMSPGTGGYFYASDFYDTPQGGFHTNKAEIFYVNGNSAAVSFDYYSSVLVHELQHMINFNEKFVKQSINSEVWINEMLSGMSEDLLALTLGNNLNNPQAIWNQRMPNLFRNFSQNRLDIWRPYISQFNPGNEPLAYGEKYAFGAYLLRNYGGAPLAKAMLANNKNGIESIDTALQQVVGVTFAQAFSRYGEAFIYSFRNMPEGANTFDKAASTTLNGITYNLQAFDVWRNFDSYIERDLYSETNSTLIPRSVHIEVPSTLRGKEISGSLDITIIKPADGVKLYLLVK